LDNLSTGRIANLAEVSDRITRYEADICDLDKISRLFKRAHYVIHLAALPSVARLIAGPLTANAVNITGTLNVLLATRDAGVKRFATFIIRDSADT
jgi:nucleoside-diphosphate-sugar epimerase